MIATEFHWHGLCSKTPASSSAMATPIRFALLALLTSIVSMSVSVLSAQTAIKLPKNKYTPEQDVKLGLEAAAEVRQQYPLITDPNIARYLTTLGDRLVAAA